MLTTNKDGTITLGFMPSIDNSKITVVLPKGYDTNKNITDLVFEEIRAVVLKGGDLFAAVSHAHIVTKSGMEVYVTENMNTTEGTKDKIGLQN